MIKYETIFNNKTLNIFTDASITRIGEETIGAPGYIAVTGSENIIDKKELIIRKTTNNQCEIYAIFMAIQCAIKNRDKVEVINIFSDSQFAIYGLREWIFKWVSNIREDTLYNSTDKPVANQEIFLNIIYTILRENLNINFYHNRGHFTGGQVRKFIELFTKHNFLDDYIDTAAACTIMYYNDMIDKSTKRLLSNINLSDIHILELPNYVASKDLDMEQYKKLLNI